MGELCFAEPFGCLDQASATEWSTSVINVFVAATWTQGIRRISGVGTWLESLMTRLLVPPQAAAWRKIHLNNAREKTVRRLAYPDGDHADCTSNSSRLSPLSAVSGALGATLLPNYSLHTLIRRIIAEIVGQSSIKFSTAPLRNHSPKLKSSSTWPYSSAPGPTPRPPL